MVFPISACPKIEGSYCTTTKIRQRTPHRTRHFVVIRLLIPAGLAKQRVWRVKASGARLRRLKSHRCELCTQSSATFLAGHITKRQQRAAQAFNQLSSNQKHCPTSHGSCQSVEAHSVEKETEPSSLKLRDGFCLIQAMQQMHNH